MFKTIVKHFRAKSRKARAEMFMRMINPQPGDTILDLGGSDGSYIASIVPEGIKIVVADYDTDALKKASSQLGFLTIQLDGSNKLNFSDEEFDIVFCSSVIEHVTGPKEEAIENTDDALFYSVAKRHQIQFANEIQRIGPQNQ